MPKWLIIVLRLLKMECDKHTICPDCWLCTKKGFCLLEDTPTHWVVEEGGVYSGNVSDT